MKISTKGRYGLKAMVDIGVNSKEDSCVCLKGIAQRQGISENYLEQLIAQLRKAGLVNSIRGANGGYVLTKDTKDITVGDVLRALEGDLQVTECANRPDGSGSAACRKCVAKTVWEKISDSMNEVVDGITLADLVQDYNNI